MSNWLPNGAFWDPRVHEKAIQEALLPGSVKEHFASRHPVKPDNASTNWLLAAHLKESFLLCVHLS